MVLGIPVSAGSVDRVFAFAATDLTTGFADRVVWRIATFEAARDASVAQLDERVEVAVVDRDAWPTDERARRLLFHNLVANLRPSGRVVTAESIAPGLEADAVACGCTRADGVDAALGTATWIRTDRVTIHDLVAHARSRLLRLDPAELARLLDAPDSDLVVLDTRPNHDRERDGTICGSIPAPRTVLEWLVDPASGYTHERIRGFE